MRLFSVIPGAVFGGAHNQALELRAPLARRGIETVVVLPREAGDALDRLAAGGLEVVEMPLHRPRATVDPRVNVHAAARVVPETRALRGLFRARRADVVQVHGPMNVHGAIAGRLEGAGIVWQILDTRPPMVIRKATMPLVVRLADVLMTTGETVARQFPRTDRVAAEDRLIPFVPPVDTERFHPDEADREIVRRHLGVRPDEFLVGAIGNRNPQKGHEHLLRSMVRVREQAPHATLRIRGAESPGHSEYEASLQRLRKELGLPDDAIGPVPREFGVPRLLRAFDAFCLASVPRSEGLPTVVLEAMATGLPVVATDVGGVREIVEDGRTGFVVAAGDDDAIASAVLRLVERPALRRSAGTAARHAVVARWSAESCARTHEEAYLLASRRATARR